MSKEEATTNSKEEDDLDDLDDLLDDFAGEVLSKPPGSAQSQSEQKDNNIVEESTNPIQDEFKTKLDDLIKDLNIQDPETKDQFEQLVKNFEEQEQDKTKDKDPKDFDAVMKDTMERLKNSGKNIDEQIKNDQAKASPDDLLAQLLSGLDSGGKDFDMSNLLVDMLDQLSSKEVLYEPIKDLNSKFPDYLKDNKLKLSDDDYNNYSKQYEITIEMVEIFERPEYDDNDKTQRGRINSLLENLQDLGQPPTELVADGPEFPGFGDSLKGLGGPDLGFSDKDLPPGFEKELEDGCKQQ